MAIDYTPPPRLVNPPEHHSSHGAHNPHTHEEHEGSGESQPSKASGGRPGNLPDSTRAPDIGGGSAGGDVVIEPIAGGDPFTFTGAHNQWFNMVAGHGVKVDAYFERPATAFVHDIFADGKFNLAAVKNENGAIDLAKLFDPRRLQGSVMTRIRMTVGAATISCDGAGPLGRLRAPMVNGTPMQNGETRVIGDTRLTFAQNIFSGNSTLKVETDACAFAITGRGGRFFNIEGFKSAHTDFEGVYGETSRGELKGGKLVPGGQGEGVLQKPWQAYALKGEP